MRTIGRYSWPQRLSEPDRNEILMWNGRLDNRDDLATSVGGGHGSCCTADAAATVLAVYGHCGVPGLRRIIGDWSVVIRDAGRDALVLASDYAGVRPLYYHWRPGHLTWSAGLEPLVTDTGFDGLDEEYIAGFLSHGPSRSRTPYAGVYAVPPGHAVVATPSTLSVNEFWSAPVGDVIRYRDERRYDEQLRALFRDAVAVRLQTSAPILAELSGGLDSSSVVCMANRLIRDEEVPTPRLTTLSYVHRDSLDVPFIHEVEKFCGITGVHLSTERDALISKSDVGEATPGGWAPLHRSAAAVAGSLGAKVFLTGQAGDLTMGNWFDDSLQVAAPLRRGQLLRTGREALAWSKTLRMPLGRILGRAIWTVLPTMLQRDRLYTFEGLGRPERAETSLRRDFCIRIGVGEPRRLQEANWMAAPPERRKHFRALAVMRDLRTLAPLEPVQHLDYTHPFAHRPLVEFVMSVPPDILCRPGEPRRLMRRALGDLWPSRLRRRKSKSLFTTPWAEALRPLALDLLGTRHWQVVARGWVDRTSLTSRLERLTHGLACNEPQLRQIILLEYWLRNRSLSQPAAAVTRTASG